MTKARDFPRYVFVQKLVPKDAFDDAFLFAVEKGAHIGAATQDEAQGAHDDGLSRAGFTRDDIQMRRKIDLELVDDRIVLD
jgi:hypothetical protein